MDLLLLPGNSLRNKDWLERAELELAPSFGKIIAHKYQHWSNGKEIIDFKAELEILDKEADELGKYIIVAKSVGSVLSVLGMKDRTFEPECCIFAGLPLSLIVQEKINVAELMGGIEVPIVILQNSDDPVGSYAEVKGYLNGGADGLLMVETPGETHDYEDFELLKRLCEKLISDFN